MIAYFYGALANSPSTSANNFAPMELGYTSASAWVATEATVYQPIPHALTADLLSVKVTTAPSAGKSYTFAVMQNGSPTSLSVTISDTNTTGLDTTHSINFNPGDTISLRAAPSGTPTAPGGVFWSVRQSATGQFAVLSGTNATAQSSAGGTQYLNPHANSNSSTTETDFSCPTPLAATITNFYVTSSTAIAAGSWTLNIRKNAGNAGQTVALTSSATSGNDLTHSARIAIGDLLAIQLVPSSGTSAAFSTGFTVVPDNVGSSWMMQCTGQINNPSTSAANYNWPFGGFGWNATESNRQAYVNALSIDGFIVTLRTAPGSGTKYVFNVRQNGVSSVLSAQVADTSTTTGLMPMDMTLSPGDLLDILSTPTGTPAATGVKTGLLISAAGAFNGNATVINNFQFPKASDNGNGTLSVTEKRR